MIGNNKNVFYLKFEENWFNKKDVLETPSGVKVVVTKVYKYNWFKYILVKLGFKVRMFEVKVEEIKN